MRKPSIKTAAKKPSKFWKQLSAVWENSVVQAAVIFAVFALLAPYVIPFAREAYRTAFPGPYVVNVPRIDKSQLSYEQFYRDFAIPRKPVVITGAGRDMFASVSS